MPSPDLLTLRELVAVASALQTVLCDMPDDLPEEVEVAAVLPLSDALAKVERWIRERIEATDVYPSA